MKKYMVSKKTGVRFDYNEAYLRHPHLYEVVLEEDTPKPVKRRGRAKKPEGIDDDVDSR